MTLLIPFKLYKQYKMPSIDIDTYKLDFFILANNNPKTIVLLDQSHYLSVPQKPLLQVTPPGFTGALQIPYTPNSITVLNSDNLTITDVTECAGLMDLSDGVWQITQMVCPYDELFTKHCYLKTDIFDNLYRNLLLNFKLGIPCLTEDEFNNGIIQADILIQSAKAETYVCNIEKATLKYKKALAIVNNLTNKINCK